MARSRRRPQRGSFAGTEQHGIRQPPPYFQYNLVKSVSTAFLTFIFDRPEGKQALH